MGKSRDETSPYLGSRNWWHIRMDGKDTRLPFDTKKLTHCHQVGPLPATPETQMLPLSYIYNSGRHFVARPFPDFEQILGWFNGIIHGLLGDMMDDLLDEVRRPSTSNVDSRFQRSSTKYASIDGIRRTNIFFG
jgi:hypothetical protein